MTIGNVSNQYSEISVEILRVDCRFHRDRKVKIDIIYQCIKCDKYLTRFRGNLFRFKMMVSLSAVFISSRRELKP